MITRGAILLDQRYDDGQIQHNAHYTCHYHLKPSCVRFIQSQESPAKSVGTHHGGRPCHGSRNDNREPSEIHEKNPRTSVKSGSKKSLQQLNSTLSRPSYECRRTSNIATGTRR